MGTLTNLNGITEPQIPAAIARDAEVTSAIASHVAAPDPHPQYLTQPEGDGRYRQSATPLADGDIPAAIARDAEVASAIASHVATPDPHPSLWQRILQNFLSLAGGQRILKNNPPITNDSFVGGKNHLELITDNGTSNPILAFHKGFVSATSLYHSGYGNNSLRIRNADGFDGALLHDGNIEQKLTSLIGDIKLTAFTATIAPVNQQTIVDLDSITLDKIVGVNCYFRESMGTQGVRFVAMADSGWFGGLSPRITNVGGNFLWIGAVTASQLVGLPVNVLVWHRQ